MKTFKTFTECKLAHPECDVYVDTCGGSEFAPTAYLTWYKCDPAVYLMSLEEFFDKGFKLAEGDTCLSPVGNVVIVKNPDESNALWPFNKNSYILKAKALEASPSHGIAAIKELDDPIMLDIVKENVTKLAENDNTTPAVRQACQNLVEAIDGVELMQKAYELHCEFYGDGAADFCSFESEPAAHDIWLYFAKKLQEQAQ